MGDQRTNQRHTAATDFMVVRLNERFAIFKLSLAFRDGGNKHFLAAAILEAELGIPVAG